ncbi:pentatricopeptide repeat-containing protein [Pyrus ussuriensis x Pyrus communis]|uniref:Pentatricopeptide repeat-containing protein n=1 Tax=Pyrus ussuriensis x Pyrus communis TaxID=2448454 RepID=A0A5N5HDF4_9ROSA|nr:pentatricopeptide repeat-containing protein [Pyrus ussuriensis x Pyrus communis]
MRKLLQFDFSAAVDGAVKDEAAKIEAIKDEPHGKIGITGSCGPGAVEQVGTAVKAELGMAWARLCARGGIRPLGP